MGAITGQMANIDPATGSTSMMFHATPHVMDFDPHSGDYVTRAARPNSISPP